jgi:hypothetical protein
MKLRTVGLVAALLLALVPHPAQAQGDFIKDKVKSLIEKSGIYVSTTTRSSIDNDVRLGQTFGVGYGTAGSKRTGIRYPFSLSGFSGDLETTSSSASFGRFKSRQLLTGIGYQWVRGKMVYGAQIGVGYSFNKVTLDPAAANAFASTSPIAIDVDNSFVVRPLVKAEYFIHPKLSARVQASYTYTDPDVIVHTSSGSMSREWRPHHMQFSVAVGVFPLRKGN